MVYCIRFYTHAIFSIPCITMKKIYYVITTGEYFEPFYLELKFLKKLKVYTMDLVIVKLKLNFRCVGIQFLPLFLWREL